MIKAIILTFIILVVIYIFLFRSTSKRKKQDFDTVAEYRDRYIEKNSLDPYRSQVNKRGTTGITNGKARTYTAYSGDSGTAGNTRYVTKYNSLEDYRDK